jgi:GT2 family glycosyltransferase
VATRGSVGVPRAALILVNYNTAADTLAAVRALEQQGVPLELVVVDNASRVEERESLGALPRHVRLVQSEENLGYGGAINRALPLVSAPVVGFLNPDTRPFPGALAALLTALDDDPRVGVVGPRTWWDEGRTLLLPPIWLPTLRSFGMRWLATRVPALGRAYSRHLARRVARVGLADRPRCLPMLSGAFLLTRRAVLDRVGGFDPGFPLYFEDVDWCRRVGRAHYRLAYVPAAEIVHHFDQSAQQVAAQGERWRAESLRYYLQKYYGALGLRAVATLERRGSTASAPRPRAIEDLGHPAAPPEFRLPEGTGAVQVALHWLCLDAALGHTPGPTWRFPPAVWARLRPGRFFLQALARDTWRPLKLWTWQR